MSEEAVQLLEESTNTLDVDFIVSGIFFLGSPIGLIAFNEKLTSDKGK